jgi:hypothetical protein
MVSDRGIKYTQNNTLDYGIQLLISDVAMIKPQFFMKETIPMDLREYLGKLKENQTVT